MLRAVLWDNDGVLVDTEELYFRASREVLAGAGVELTRAHYMDVSMRQGLSVFDLAAAQGVDAERIEQLRAARNDLYSRLVSAGNLVIDGVAETLRALHGRVAMGIVTSSRRDHFELIHATTGLLPYFDFVLTREDFAQSKPHPDAYLAALDRAGLHADDCVAVEDSERGLVAANAAGLRCLVVPTALTRGGDFRAAHKVLRDVREVVAEIR